MSFTPITTHCMSCNKYLGVVRECDRCGSERSHAEEWHRKDIILDAGRHLYRTELDYLVVVDADNQLHCLNSSDGNTLWPSAKAETGLTVRPYSHVTQLNNRIVAVGEHAVHIIEVEAPQSHVTVPTRGHPGNPCRFGRNVVIGTSTKTVHWLDWNATGAIRHVPVSIDALPPVPPIIAYAGGQLLVGAGNTLLTVDTQGRLQGHPHRLGGSIRYIVPSRHGAWILLRPGGVRYFDAYRQRFLEFELPGTISCAPISHGKSLYVAVHSNDQQQRWFHRLSVDDHAIIAEAHPSSTGKVSGIALRHELLYATSRRGEVAVFDTEFGFTELWRAAGLGKGMVAPRLDSERVYLGNKNGVVALPWHMGEWRGAADYYLRRGAHAQAAPFLALAGDIEGATQSWCAVNAYRRAAELQWQQGKWGRAAELFDRAGQNRSPLNSRESSGLFNVAAILYEKAERTTQAAECRRKAATSGNFALLHLEPPAYLPTFRKGIEGEMSVTIRNEGRGEAERVEIWVAGPLKRAVALVFERVAAGATMRVTFLELVPIVTGDHALQLDIVYSGSGFEDHRIQALIPIVVAEGPDVQIDGDVGAMIIKVPAGEPIPEIIRKGDTGLVRIEVQSA